MNWDSYIVSFAKTASKKNGSLIGSMKFFLSEVALYLYKSTIWPCLEYCCHVWAGAPSCYFDMSDKLQKQICRTLTYDLNNLSLKFIEMFFLWALSNQICYILFILFSTFSCISVSWWLFSLAWSENLLKRDCWSFTCCLPGTLDSLSKCNQLKSFL